MKQNKKKAQPQLMNMYRMNAGTILLKIVSKNVRDN